MLSSRQKREVFDPNNERIKNSSLVLTKTRNENRHGTVFKTASKNRNY